jgi:outer membrane protein
MNPTKLTAVAALVAATLVVPASVVPVDAQDLKIAVLVPQRLLASTKVGKKVAEKLKKRKEDAQKKLDAKAEEIKDLQDDLVKRAMVLSEDERRKAREDFEQQQRDAARLKEDLERELQRAEGEVVGEASAFLNEVIKDFGEENGYDLILDASAAVYFSEASDITDRVIEAADARSK